jgi:uncharacterized protein
VTPSSSKGIRPRIWYIPIFFLAPAIMLLSYWAIRLMGRPLPEPNIPLQMVPVFFILFFITAAFEETGWSGYAIDPMQDRGGALRASIILGLIWAIFHTIPWLQANAPAWAAGQFVSTIALRIFIVWLCDFLPLPEWRGLPISSIWLALGLSPK